MNRPLASVLVTVLCLAGCATYRQNLVLEPVGPPSAPTSAAGSAGSLVVFSAFEAGGTGDPERARHTSYKLFTDDGKLLQAVRNNSGTAVDDPTLVELVPGTYRVVARANGHGLVTVPVVVAANRVTTVHLEGGGPAPDLVTLTAANAVRLPDGQRVGWRAASTNSGPASR